MPMNNNNNNNADSSYQATDDAIHTRMHRSEVSEQQQQQRQRARARSTNTPPPSRRVASAAVPEVGQHRHISYVASPIRRRQSTPYHPHPHHLHSAIYTANHPINTDEEYHDSNTSEATATATATVATTTADVLDVHNASMRRAARELLGGTRMRSRSLVVDLNNSLFYHQRQPSSESMMTASEENDGGEDGITDDQNDDEANEEDEVALGGGVVKTTKGSDEELAILDTETGLEISPSGVIDETTPLVLPKLDHSTSSGRRHSTHTNKGTHHHHHHHHHRRESWLSTAIQQTSAVAVVALLNIMISIPFGSSYFPIGWRAVDGGGDPSADTNSAGEEEDAAAVDEISGNFPLPGKQALGIRMFLFATIMGQIAFTFASKFENPVGLQMVENVPFLHALCQTVIRNQGYGKEALSTVFFLFAFSSVLVGMTFYLLGKWKLGRIVYFFPNHVLVGCIGGIGVFIVVTALEVTSDVTFTFDMDGVRGLVEHFNLLSVVLGFEIVLRLLQYLTHDKHGNAKYPLLSPVYYCLITPLFYLGLSAFGVSIEQASEQGYFFPAVVSEKDGDASASGNSIWDDPHMWDIFQIINVSTISWTAVIQSTGTMIALAAFSLIHVPINIPAFAISTDVDTDMNAELIAHGFANGLSGMFGGLQTYMTYSNSVLYAKSGGKGKISSLAIVVLTIVLFVIGPSIASYLPRCMAGTLLLHIGIDLVLEGVYDSFGNYDHLEYAGIWAITVVMTLWGMTAALIAGVIAALTTYAVQSINYQNPIRQVLTASTLRSSAWTRCVKSREILENDATGRARILIFQLQGHLFFGNVAQLTDTIKKVLKEKKDFDESPIVVIVDFTLVVGMDSSAAHAVAKLKKIIHRLFHVEVSIFVTGSGRGGFPCEFALSKALNPSANQIAAAGLDYNELLPTEPSTSITITSHVEQQQQQQQGTSPQVQRGSISVSRGTSSVRATKQLTPKADGRVCESLDDALRFAEDILIAREDPSLECSTDFRDLEDFATINMTLEEEKFYAKKFLSELLPKSSENVEQLIGIILGAMGREEFSRDESLWESGAESDSMKLLVFGELLSIIEDTGATELVKKGNVVGELGLVHGTKRLTTLVCTSEKAILYSLSKEEFEKLKKKKPQVTVAIDGVVIRYLAHRVQHVNNRYFHTTLPV